LFRNLFFSILLLLSALRLVAQSVSPSVEVVLSTDQAQDGDTIYADVVIHDGQALAGADIGITTGECLRVVERQPGNYLPSTSENGGFSPFEELTENSTRFAVAVTDRTRIASGDGTFYRVAMEVTCEDATPEVSVTFAELAALAHPDTDSNELLGFSLEQGSISVVSDSLTVRQGAVVSTPPPIEALAPPAGATNQNLILGGALAVMGVSVVGMVILLVVYQQRRRRKRS
jgi:hypothetical protein